MSAFLPLILEVDPSRGLQFDLFAGGPPSAEAPVTPSLLRGLMRRAELEKETDPVFYGGAS